MSFQGGAAFAAKGIGAAIKPFFNCGAVAANPAHTRWSPACNCFHHLPRAHGRLRNVSGTHRYVVTAGGRKIITALLANRQADVEQLPALAA